MTKEEFDKACRDLEPTAIKALERAMREGGAPALKAAEMLLAYTQGKPAQTVAVNGEVGLTVNILRFGERSDVPVQLPSKTQQPLTIEN